MVPLDGGACGWLALAGYAGWKGFAGVTMGTCPELGAIGPGVGFAVGAGGRTAGGIVSGAVPDRDRVGTVEARGAGGAARSAALGAGVSTVWRRNPMLPAMVALAVD
jgi:hypothetical protein